MKQHLMNMAYKQMRKKKPLKPKAGGANKFSAYLKKAYA